MEEIDNKEDNKEEMEEENKIDKKEENKIDKKEENKEEENDKFNKYKKLGEIMGRIFQIADDFEDYEKDKKFKSGFNNHIYNNDFDKSPNGNILIIISFPSKYLSCIFLPSIYSAIVISIVVYKSSVPNILSY